jgi:hypothetical protein
MHPIIYWFIVIILAVIVIATFWGDINDLLDEDPDDVDSEDQF